MGLTIQPVAPGVRSITHETEVSDTFMSGLREECARQALSKALLYWQLRPVEVKMVGLS